MKSTLQPGATARLAFMVPKEKTVPHLYPEAPDFQAMPAVFATGFMVGLMEWCCIEVLKPHLDQGEGSLGIHINVSHAAATVPARAATTTPTIHRSRRRTTSTSIPALPAAPTTPSHPAPRW